ncbi:TetR/AcrR family transcriptional regulator [Lactobacillus sp. ESL0731]|uniref:TetR/AcrR family transcriptional regulator n=1 Tax=unclassified Lactobacillus TaxID=2620435 RepID=UPI0023F65141|nr:MULTISPECIES: TetR/AcrR family transcriptional regulator [unclassified Lactobacillus]WEV50649.1 TetR/AcrR family transcriptional regulator [Lactobacillus sp. ESL0700]WEV61779.1 TetR/AcrR family transcriptional regulator [Lactobacillus sp. ESL0731]
MSSCNQANQHAKQKIQQLYLKMINETPNQRVKIIDLCKRAGINRSTFYSYYYDADEVLEELQVIHMNALQKILADDAIKHQNLKQALTKILTLIKQEQNFYYYYFVTKNQATTLNVLDNSVIVEELKQQNNGCGSEEFIYDLNFFNGGMAAIIKLWLKNDCQTPVASLVTILLNKINKNA